MQFGIVRSFEVSWMQFEFLGPSKADFASAKVEFEHSGLATFADLSGKGCPNECLQVLNRTFE